MLSHMLFCTGRFSAEAGMTNEYMLLLLQWIFSRGDKGGQKEENGGKVGIGGG